MRNLVPSFLGGLGREEKSIRGEGGGGWFELLKCVLSSAARSRVLARPVSLAQTGELARRLYLLRSAVISLDYE